jgi:hypothetical protein
VRFLLARPGAVEGQLERLAEAGFDEVLVVSVDPERTLTRLGPYSVSEPSRPHRLQWEDGGALLVASLERP